MTVAKSEALGRRDQIGSSKPCRAEEKNEGNKMTVANWYKSDWRQTSTRPKNRQIIGDRVSYRVIIGSS